ncbi:MAG: hypothetical protein HC857_10560 [Synechococcales cyanobacterium RU_4_20]|nr:hypothetical protein [Synechococcales cyanobacterium RU_4_20]
MVYFEVPDAERIFAERAFWDVYYEHCSYFSPPSLTALCGAAGLPDIGEHFPDTDPRYKNADSRTLLADRLRVFA